MSDHDELINEGDSFDPTPDDPEFEQEDYDSFVQAQENGYSGSFGEYLES